MRITQAMLARLALLLTLIALPAILSAENAVARKAAAADAITRGLAFIEKDAAAWKAEKKCSNCHHGMMTLYALQEAKRQGYLIEPSLIADTTAWVKERLDGIEKPRDPRPGFSMINTVALFMGSMGRGIPGAVPKQEIDQIARHISTHLEDDGAVLTPATMNPPLPKNGPPPVFESREVMTLQALLQMRSSDAKSEPAVQAALTKASDWLSHVTPGEDMQAMALRLEVAFQEKSRGATRSGIDAILKRQNPDGGWGQIRGAISDAFATGRVLYSLNLAGVDRNRSEIQRAVAFLVANQKPDGSWPMIPRAQPGATPMTNPSPITHIGSAWGLIGLLRSSPPPPPPSSPAVVRGAVDKSLAFLREDAVAWRKKSDCATCHHGAMTAFAFAEAKSRGLSTEEATLKEMLDWSKARFVPAYEQTPNLKNGFEIPSVAMPILTLAGWTTRDAFSSEESDRIAKYILDRQQPDGSWIGPPVNGPPVFESREIMAIWFYFALEPAANGSGERASAYRIAREKAMGFLKNTPVGDTSQAVALRLLLDVHDRAPARKLLGQVAAFLKRQNPDGGWSQVKELPSDAYATGQALYVLSLAGVKPNRPEIQKAAAYLVTSQKADGSWAMASRETRDRKPAKNLLPIAHFGSAWATIGLIRTLPPLRTTASKL